MPEGYVDQLGIAVCAKAPADYLNMFVDSFHRDAESFGNLLNAPAGGKMSEYLYLSICQHKGWVETRFHDLKSSLPRVHPAVSSGHRNNDGERPPMISDRAFVEGGRWVLPRTPCPHERTH
jgi:hypothetical protein